jgi:hypothetical protein
MLDPTALDLLLGLLEAVKWLLALAHPKKTDARSGVGGFSLLRWFWERHPMHDLGVDAVAADKAPDIAVEEAGPSLAVVHVDKDGLVSVREFGIDRAPDELGEEVGAHFAASLMSAGISLALYHFGSFLTPSSSL